MEIWSFIEEKTQKNSAVYIENSRHFLVKRVYIYFFQKQQKRTQSFLNCRLCSSLSVPCILPPPSLPPKNLAKDTHWTNFWDIFNYNGPIFWNPIFLMLLLLKSHSMQIFNYRLVKIRLFFDTQHFCTFQKKSPISKNI